MNYLLVILGMVVIFFFCFSKRENFTIAEREGVLCNPIFTSAETILFPNSKSFTVQGYIYKETPIVYRNGKKIVPLNFKVDSNSLVYYFTVYAPEGSNSEWILETSDFIEPLINDGNTGKRVKVDLVRRRQDFNKWRMHL